MILMAVYVKHTISSCLFRLNELHSEIFKYLINNLHMIALFAVLNAYCLFFFLRLINLALI